MSHLIPQQRPDKNGHIVTRHVRADSGANAASAKLSGLGAPPVRQNASIASYTRSFQPFSSNPHIPGKCDKIIETSTGKKIGLSFNEIPEDTDLDALQPKVMPYFDDELTPSEKDELDQQSAIFVHEAAALANSEENTGVAAEHIPEGAYVDLNGCAFIPKDQWGEHAFEYAEVEEVEHNGNEVVLHTSQGSVSLPADYTLPAFTERLNDIASPYSPEQINKATRAALSSALEDARYSEQDEDEDGEVDLDAFDIDNITDATFKEFRTKIEKFVKSNPWAVESSGVSPEAIGHDYYMTAAGHGVGFTDREEIPVSSRNALTDAIRKDRSLSMEGGSMYLGDDGIPYWGG